MVGRRYRDVQCVDSQTKRPLRPFHCQAVSTRPLSTLICPHKHCMSWSASPWGPVGKASTHISIYETFVIMFIKKKMMIIFFVFFISSCDYSLDFTCIGFLDFFPLKFNNALEPCEPDSLILKIIITNI